MTGRLAARSSTLPQVKLTSDPDLDDDEYGGEPDNEDELLGRPADTADVREVTSLVKRYYAAAAAANGAEACRLLYTPLAESAAADFGGPPGSAGTGECAPFVSKLFERSHARLSTESATVSVTGLRVEANLGAARLSFRGKKNVRYILVHRERGGWRVAALFDITGPVRVE